LEYAREKTYVSTSKLEFAKRILVDRKEITPFPISGIPEVTRRFYLLLGYFKELEVKGWVYEKGSPA